MNDSRLETATVATRHASRLWRSADARARFEMELGLKPIGMGDSLDLEVQHQSGRTAEYHKRFMEWAAEQREEHA